jgi:hypothetical protein
MSVLGAVATIAAGVLVVGVHRRFSQPRGTHKPSLYGQMTGVVAVTGLSAFLALFTALLLVWQ